MKRFLTVMCIIAILLTVSITNTSAKTFNWYCMREKDHKTPACPPEFSFIKDHGGYAVDTKHQSYDDAEKVIYLTFDAGYENGNIEKILDILKEEEVCAAFFVLGNLVVRNTELVKRMADEGHLVCNHTYSHKNMSTFGDEAFANELKRLEDIYREKTGKELARFYRPPEGSFSAENLKSAEKLGYKTIFWSFAYADWDNAKQSDSKSAIKKITENLHNGEIMLLHPTSETNALIMGEIIRYAKAEGFRFASLEEL